MLNTNQCILRLNFEMRWFRLRGKLGIVQKQCNCLVYSEAKLALLALLGKSEKNIRIQVLRVRNLKRISMYLIIYLLDTM